MALETETKSTDAMPAEEMAGTALRRPLWLLAAALFVGWTADLLFYAERPGVSVPVFAALLAAVLWGLARLEGRRPARRNLWLAAVLAFFAAMVAVRADPLLAFLDVVLCSLLLGNLACFFLGGDATQPALRTYFTAPLLALGYALVRPARLLAGAVNLKAAGRQGRQNLLPIARGLLLALPVLVGFGFLLASADFVFEQLVKDLLDFRIPPVLLDLFFQGVVTLAAAWLVAGGLAYALTPGADRYARLAAPGRPLFRLGFVETVTLLGAVNMLFFVFVWIQFTYLFGGEASLAEEGYTYAEYARRGFLDLAAVSVMTLALILTLQRVARLETPAAQHRFSVLSTVLVALVLVILASAFQRLRLYEDAFGFTRLRVYSHVFMVWLGFVLVWLALTRWWRRARFGVGAFAAILGFFVTINLLNPDAFIARRNLERFEATGKLDVRYLTWLSHDATPVLVDALPGLRGHNAFILEQNLRERREALREHAAAAGWPSGNLGRLRARRALESSNDEVRSAK